MSPIIPLEKVQVHYWKSIALFFWLHTKEGTALNEKQTSKPTSPYEPVMNSNTKLLECGFESVMTLIS